MSEAIAVSTRKVTAEQDRVTEFEKLMSEYVSSDVENWLIDKGFFTQAASTRFHGNYEGGLFDHSLAVMKNLVVLTNSLHLEWKKERSPYIVGMFHDLCKIDQYRKLRDGSYQYVNTSIRGHGTKSVILLSNLIELTDEECDCIEFHMGAFTDKSEWNEYTSAIHRHKNVLWTHNADMMASHFDGI